MQGFPAKFKPSDIQSPMNKVVSLDKARKKARDARKKGMCQHDIHQWKIWHEKQFDPKAGKLVTVYRCARCGKQKVKTL